jgi:hypothetical protein
METTLMKEPLNKTLNTFLTAKTTQESDELTSLYLGNIQKKMDAETDKWWEENNMTVEKFEEMCSNLHFRTPYITK